MNNKGGHNPGISTGELIFNYDIFNSHTNTIITHEPRMYKPGARTSVMCKEGWMSFLKPECSLPSGSLRSRRIE